MLNASWASPVAAAVALWTLTSGLPSLAWPLARDQGIFATTAWRALRGDLPYVDAFTFKPPGTIGLYMVAEVLFGPSMVGIRVVDLLIVACTASAIAWLAAVYTKRRAVAWTSGLLYGPMVLGLGWWHTAQTDGWTASLAVFVLVATTQRRMLVAGVLVGALLATKATGLGMLAPAVVVAWRQGRHAVGRLVMGAFAVVALVALGMVAGGIWPSFMESQAMAARHARFARPPFAPVQVVAWVVAGLPGAWVARLGLLGVPFLPRLHERAPDAVKLGVLFALGGAVSVAIQGRYWGYHLAVLLPAAAWSAGAAADRLLGDLRQVRTVVFGAAVCSAWVAMPPSSWAFLVASLQDRPAALRTWTADDPRGFAPFVDLADVLRHAPDHPVLFLGFDPLPLYLAERPTISRYTFVYPLIVPWGNATHRARLLDELHATPPGLVVVATGDAVANMTGDDRDSAQHVDDWPALSDWLTSNCTRSDDVAGYRRYRCVAPR